MNFMYSIVSRLLLYDEPVSINLMGEWLIFEDQTFILSCIRELSDYGMIEEMDDGRKQLSPSFKRGLQVELIKILFTL